MNSSIKQISGMLILFLFFLSIFFCITAPIEIRNVIKSKSWESRGLEILSSKVIRTRGRKGRHHFLIEIYAKDLANDTIIKISDVRYGDMPFTFSALGKILSSDHEYDVKRYPAGAKVIGYKAPDSEKYVLEKGNILIPVIALSLAALWLLGNVFIMVRYPKKQKKEEDSFLLNS